VLESILTTAEAGISISNFFICTAVSLILGLGLTGIHMYRNCYTKNFLTTLILLPVIVQMIIMMVNGNLGTGVAVMGAFSLVRFRSMPGNSREITSIFLAMAVGLATGMGYLGVAIIFVILVGLVVIICITLPFGRGKEMKKELKITIPENLDYTDIFDDLFQQYTKYVKLLRVKTTNMGSLYEFQYEIQIEEEKKEKEMIDKLRCRNGNLSITCGHFPDSREEL